MDFECRSAESDTSLQIVSTEHDRLLETPLLQTSTKTPPPLIPPLTGFGPWAPVLSEQTGIDRSLLVTYSKLFQQNEVPPPSADMMSYMTHSLLLSIGIEKAGHRARILHACALYAHHLATSSTQGPSPLDSDDGADPQSMLDTTEGQYSPSPFRRRRKSLSGGLLLSPYRLTVSTLRSKKGFEWVSIVGKDHTINEATQKLATQYNLHKMFIAAFTSKLPMPQLVTNGNCVLVILRVPILKIPPDADDLNQLTNRFVIIVNLELNYIITYQRVDNPYMASIRAEFATENVDAAYDGKNYSNISLRQFLRELVDAVLSMYMVSILHCENLLDSYEGQMLDSTKVRPDKVHSLKGYHIPGSQVLSQVGSKKNKPLSTLLYHLQRRASVFGRMLGLCHEVVQELIEGDQRDPFSQDLVDTIQNLCSKVEFLHDNCHNLLNLHLAFNSNRLEKLMRLLTMFSVFFTPMVFVCGVYGMNFDNMPELHWQYGYPYALSVMLGGVIVVFLVLKRRGLI